MATNTRLVTFNAQNVTPQDDALLYETAIPQTGIIYGANLTANGTNTVHIETGFGIVRGRFFEIFESDIAIPLSASGEIQGRIIGRLDLSNIDDPFVILAQTGTLAPLRQDADVNIFNGVHEFLMATFVVNEVTISNFQDVKPTSFGGTNIVNALPATGVEGMIYLVPHEAEMQQYIWHNGAFVPIGVQDIDLSSYAKLASPTFTGTPTVPNISVATTESQQIANSRFVWNAIRNNNRNAFANFRVGSTLIQADNRVDTLEVVAGRNITLVPDAENDKLTIHAKYTLCDVIEDFADVPNSTATDREYTLTPNIAGFYIATVAIRIPPAGGARRIFYIYRKRGTTLTYMNNGFSMPPVNGADTEVTIPAFLHCQVGDKLVVRMYQNSGSTLENVRLYIRAIAFEH